MANQQVGLIRSDCWKHLQAFSDVFIKVEAGDSTEKDKKPGVYLSPDLNTPSERTKAVNHVLEKLRKDDVFDALRGWRHEVNI